ncbi:hypothetical protein H5410_041860 [Solanum commersonii]|uniref:Uncharacterized protein n=1 Tax=Solanum commersonii TaxID=4109 RepID=A0A9J5XUD5_SOLCO|nr:hypothetical protein H5410_041860 [Solanum commersonii]
MAPKAKNVAGSKRSRKGETFGSSSGRDRCKNLVKRMCKGTPKCDPDVFNDLKDKPSYRDIRHTLCGVDSNARGTSRHAIAFHPDLTGKLVDVTTTKELDTSHGPILSAPERQAHDDSVMARMFGMAELQLRIGGRPVTDAEMVAAHYPLSESAAFLCKTGLAFLEPLDDDEVTADEVMEDEKDAIMDKKANVLMATLAPDMADREICMDPREGTSRSPLG